MVQSGEQDAQNSPSCFSLLTPTICWEAASSRKPSLTPLHVLRKSSAPPPGPPQAGARPPLGCSLSWPGAGAAGQAKPSPRC